MRRTTAVFVGSQPVRLGTIWHDRQGARESAAFGYDAAWLDSPERFSIDPALPLVAGPQFHRRHEYGSVFHAAISDTEPDGWARRVILRDLAKRRQQAGEAERAPATEHLSSVDFLLAVDDFSRVGALRFQDESGLFQRAPDPAGRTAPPLIELGALLAATTAVERNSETAADLAYLRGCGTSLGGLRPKCTVVDYDGHLSIGKFPSVTDERAVTKGEVLALGLAMRAGIAAATARLVHSDNTPVALIRRFDRTASGARIMYVSAATLLGVDPVDPGTHAYTEIVDALRTHGAAAGPDIEELWRRIAFSILINNVDDHLRNHGFLHVERGKWRLAPAFDLNPFPERVRELKTWVTEETGPQATIDALVSATPYFRITAGRAKEILAEVERSVRHWRSEGRRIGLTKAELDQFAEAFEHPERQAARKAIG